MDVRDGFIVSIYNYCDSWCETCAFTSRCRVFADVAETEAALDPQLQAIVNAPLPPSDDPPPPGWMAELIDEMNAASAAPELPRLEPRRTPVPVAHLALRERSRTYCEQVHGWLRARDCFSINAPDDPRAVVGWFHTLIPAKVARAVVGLAEDGPVHDGPADYDGSAKVALIGLDRSHAAWLQIVESGFAPYEEVAPFIADVVWLGEAIEQAFPEARAFVRPGFDEPEAVARLQAGEDG
jgi:hypothetical protein